MTLGDGTPVPLAARSPAGQTRFGFAALQAYRIARDTERGPWKIRTAAGTELPVGQNALQPQLAAAHLPTRRIALEDVLRLLIEQFGVRPARTDWDRTLRESRESFKADRTWL